MNYADSVSSRTSSSSSSSSCSSSTSSRSTASSVWDRHTELKSKIEALELKLQTHIFYMREQRERDTRILAQWKEDLASMEVFNMIHPYSLKLVP
eukprot:CAMPEP_0113689094 /NCGR_PEP_ID=MMETSP0038_2-20120614/16942_1 /TAXON_ID=2898 /ORGANISM="Cryptomonas paramecium" /LENGTH=94 /DNA_ID=CAMNT_0000610065 /DNA_START=44 /DNA_END=324 /DNA_ORIENTATION=- /assembly_acc=CAM_ASM_000170